MGTRVQRTARGGRLALPETRASWARSRDVAASRLVSSRVARAAERDKAGANQPVSTSSPTATVAAPSLQRSTLRLFFSRKISRDQSIGSRFTSGMEEPAFVYTNLVKMGLLPDGASVKP